jgi:hypothetical protein
MAPMKHRTKLAAAAIIVAGGLGTAAGVASAQSDSPPPSSPPATSTPATNGARAQFICANLAQIEKVQADHATTIADTLTLLASAKTAAQDAGRTKLVTRIDNRTTKLTDRQSKVAGRQQKLADFAKGHCPAS